MFVDKTYFNLWKKAVCDKVKENINLPDLSDDKILNNYITYIRKCMFFRAKIEESKEIKEEISHLSDLSTVTVYEEIKRRLKHGEGVAPYLSKRAKALKPDYLFLDWNILHLHLGNLRKGNEYANRTNETLHLFLPPKSKKVYFIKIGHHFKDSEPDPYVDKNELRIIYTNWEKLLDKYEIHNFVPTCDVSDEERKKYRENGIMVFTDFKDQKGKKHVVMPASYSTGKTSDYVQEIVDLRIPNFINSIIDYVKHNINRSELISKGSFYYCPDKNKFYFGIIKNTKFNPYIFYFSSIDFWQSILEINNTKFDLKINKKL